MNRPDRSGDSDRDAVEPGGRDDRLLCWSEVEHIASISRSTAWRMERDGAFPRRVRVSPGRVGWWESELTLWKRTRSGETPPPPSRKAARAPRLPGMARAMPGPGPARPSDGAAPRTGSVAEPDAVTPSTKRRRRAPVSADQIDFGF